MVIKRLNSRCILLIALILCAIIECLFVLAQEHIKTVSFVIAIFLIAMVLAVIKILEIKNAASNSEINAK